MLQISFLDLPVYRLKEENYYRDRRCFVDKKLVNINNKELYERFSNQFNKIYGGEWKYNEIIGFISLHFLGSQVRGEYWQTEVKRIVRTRKKTFVWKTHKLAVEGQLHNCKNSLEVFGEIVKYISACKEELPNRYIDDTKFLSIGPYVDWIEMIQNYEG